MRWKKKKEKTKYGETRIINRFLIFPKTIQDETRWLEKASWVERAEYRREELLFSYRLVLNWDPIDWLENCVLDKLTK